MSLPDVQTLERPQHPDTDPNSVPVALSGATLPRQRTVAEASARATAEPDAAVSEPAAPPTQPRVPRWISGLSPRRVVVGVLAVAVLIASAVAGTLVALSKSVTLVVDGQRQQISTMSDTVAGALESAGIVVGQHDSLAPAADQPITDGTAVTLNRGRLVTLTIDGTTIELWTTARTVDEALAELGQDPRSLTLSADRSREIPVDGLALTAATLHTVTITDGAGTARGVVSPAATVADLLAGQGIRLGALDTVTPALSTPVTDGTAVSITRTVLATVVENQPVPQPADVTTEDPNLDRGTTTVVTQGSGGTASVTYRVVTVNGVQTEKTLVSQAVAVAPVATQISVGTKTTLTWVGDQVFFNDTEFGVNWDGLAMCESTHNPKAVNGNPSAGLPTYGLFQFDLPTWASVGGSGNPIDATPEEQIMRAKLLYQSRGLEPWACRYAA